MSFLRTAYKVIPLPSINASATPEGDMRDAMAAALEKVLMDYVDDGWTFVSIASARHPRADVVEFVDLVILERGS